MTEGGVLNQVTRELNIEALPDDIPDSITHDVSALEINATLTLAAITVPEGVTLLDDPEETVIATITPPTRNRWRRRSRPRPSSWATTASPSRPPRARATTPAPCDSDGGDSDGE